jgi:hypothetical protein
MGIMHETAYYSGIRFASRFAALWFLPTLLQHEKSSSEPTESAKYLREKFSAMVTDDLRIQKPEFVVIAKDLKIKDIAFIFLDFFFFFRLLPKNGKITKKSTI